MDEYGCLSTPTWTDELIRADQLQTPAKQFLSPLKRKKKEIRPFRSLQVFILILVLIAVTSGSLSLTYAGDRCPSAAAAALLQLCMFSQISLIQPAAWFRAAYAQTKGPLISQVTHLHRSSAESSELHDAISLMIDDQGNSQLWRLDQQW